MASRGSAKRRRKRIMLSKRAAAVTNDTKSSRSPATHVLICNAALDEDSDGDIVLRGRIDPATLYAIKVDSYQREVQGTQKLNSIVAGFAENSIPDVVLGMRGSRTKDDGASYVLLSDVYVIDGLQRISVAKRLSDAGELPRLGALVYFDTTYDWERNHFKVLNSARVRVTSNVLLRNARHDFTAIESLYKMCYEDTHLVIKDKVCWNQPRRRSQLITATTFLRVVAHLHGHVTGGRGGKIDDLCRGLERLQEIVGRNTLRSNVREFFNLVERCWGISTVTYDGAPQLRCAFLLTLANLLSDHGVFWNNTRLFVSAPLVRKIALFNVMDPQIVNLCSISGKVNRILYLTVLDHINSGKRTRRLVPRTHKDSPDEVDREGTDSLRISG
jgi:hypothetical protein